MPAEIQIKQEPTATFAFTVEQITAIRAMLKVELVSSVTQAVLTAALMNAAISEDPKRALSQVVQKTSHTIVRDIEGLNSIEHNFIAALGCPYGVDVLKKYALDQKFNVTMLRIDAELLEQIVRHGLYNESLELLNTPNGDGADAVTPLLMMAKNKAGILDVLTVEPTTFDMPAPKGGLLN